MCETKERNEQKLQRTPPKFRFYPFYPNALTEREREREKLRDTEANKVSANEFRRLRVHARETMRKIGRYVVPTGGVFKGGARERARFL